MKDKILSIFLVIIIVFNTFTTSIFAENSINTSTYQENFQHQYYNNYLDALYGDNWQRKYTITLLNEENNENSMFVIPAINNGTLDKIQFEANLPNNLRLIDFQVTENNNYVSNNTSLFAIDTVFDIGCLTISLLEYSLNPNFWNAFNVVIDGIAVVLPFVPSVTGIKGLITGSDKLADAMKWGVARYDDLADAKKNISRFRDYQTHHIIEKRFASRFGISNTDSMLSIIILKSDHSLITNKMREKIPYGTNYNSLSRSYIKNKMIEGYDELYEQTGDELFEFLSRFVQESEQFSTTKHVNIRVPE